MHAGISIERIRAGKDLVQEHVSAHLGIGNSNNYKLENGHSELWKDEFQKLIILYGMTTKETLSYGNGLPAIVNVKRKSDNEKLHIINQLHGEDKQTIYIISDTMLSKQKFQTFFEHNLQISK